MNLQMLHIPEIDYDHSSNHHTMSGAQAGFRALYGRGRFKSVLDVGCGTGTWLKAALDSGVNIAVGIDGIRIPGASLLFPTKDFHLRDLREPFDLQQRFDLAMCLEVAEHLDECYADQLVRSLARHSDKILFSAACPGQPGQHHVNCQWPSYWQELFNRHGFACSDWPRWKIWNVESVEPWYRQNVMEAIRNPERAGSEPRIPPVIHPAFLRQMSLPFRKAALQSFKARIDEGKCPSMWYIRTAFAGAYQKMQRKVKSML